MTTMLLVLALAGAEAPKAEAPPVKGPKIEYRIGATEEQKKAIAERRRKVAEDKKLAQLRKDVVRYGAAWRRLQKIPTSCSGKIAQAQRQVGRKYQQLLNEYRQIVAARKKQDIGQQVLKGSKTGLDAKRDAAARKIAELKGEKDAADDDRSRPDPAGVREVRPDGPGRRVPDPR